MFSSSSYRIDIFVDSEESLPMLHYEEVHDINEHASAAPNVDEIP